MVIFHCYVSSPEGRWYRWLRFAHLINGGFFSQRFTKLYGTPPSRMSNGSSTTSHSGDLVSAGRHSLEGVVFWKLRVQWICLREKLQDNPIFTGKIHSCRFSPKKQSIEGFEYLHISSLRQSNGGKGKSNVVRDIFLKGRSLIQWMFQCMNNSWRVNFQMFFFLFPVPASSNAWKKAAIIFVQQSGRNPENGVERPYHSPSFHIHFHQPYKVVPPTWVGLVQ